MTSCHLEIRLSLRLCFIQCYFITLKNIIYCIKLHDHRMKRNLIIHSSFLKDEGNENSKLAWFFVVIFNAVLSICFEGSYNRRVWGECRESTSTTYLCMFTNSFQILHTKLYQSVVKGFICDHFFLDMNFAFFFFVSWFGSRCTKCGSWHLF